MKLRSMISAVSLAAVSITSASAATAIDTYTSVLLGFRATADAPTGASSALFVGLDGIGQQTFDLSSVLANRFGSNWYSNGEIRWGVYGTTMGDENGLLEDGTPGYGVTRFGSLTNATFSVADGFWDAVGSAANQLDTAKVNLNAAGLSVTPDGYSYGVLSGADYGVLTGDSGMYKTFFSIYSAQTSYPSEFDLSQVTSLNINQFLPLETLDGFASHSIVGVISVGADGVITVVPEPSTYALMGLGALVVFFVARRARVS